MTDHEWKHSSDKSRRLCLDANCNEHNGDPEMTEQTFTDEELAYLKAELPHNESILFQSARKAFRLEALITRLEAAEDCRESLEDVLNHGLAYPNGAMHEANTDLAKERIEIWRKISGKAPR